MDFSGATTAVAVTAFCILFVAHVVKLARDLLTPECRKRALEVCSKLARLLRSWFRKPTMVDDFDQEVACRLLDRQLNQFRSALQVMLLISALRLAISFYKAIIGLHVFHTPAQDIVRVLVYASLLLADWCPWLVTKRSLDWWYSGLMSLLGLFIIPPFCASDHLLESEVMAKIAWALLSVARMNLSAVVLWSGVHVACQYWAHAAQGQGMAPELVLFWPIMLSMLVGKLEAQLAAELRTDAEAKVMQDRHSASDALSAMFYDVVVELDRSRCIAAPTPQLATFLLRSMPMPPERTPLEDLLPDEEHRVRLRHLLCPADGPRSSSFVELAHARMRGGMGTVFQVDLFGRQRYLVGIRDARDFERGGSPRAPARPHPAAMTPLNEVAVVIDPYENEFHILSHTRGFSSRIMPVAKGACFLPAIVQEAKFAEWVRDAVNRHIAALSEDEEEPDEPPLESRVVTFRPHGRNTPMRTRAICTLKVKERHPSDRVPQGGQFAVEFKCSGIVQGTRGRKMTSGDGNSGSSSSSSSSSSSRGTPSFNVPGGPGRHLRRAHEPLRPMPLCN